MEVGGLTKRQLIVRAYLNEAAKLNWQWGTVDCAHFVGGLVTELSGEIYGREYRYQTETGCALILTREGGVRGLMTKYLGPERTDWAECRDGDVVVAYLTDGETLGIATPANGQAAFKPKEGTGIIKIPLGRCHAFWSVPCLV